MSESTSPPTPGNGEAEPASFENLTPEAGAPVSKDNALDMVMDVPVTVTLEVGRTRMSVRDLLQLTHGSVVELDRRSGEPLDVLVNGTLVARGEVVVINDHFGIRITDVVTPVDRMKQLGA